MRPDSQLDTDLRALAESLRRSADFAERVTARVADLPPPRRRRFAAPVLIGVGCFGAFAVFGAVVVGVYLMSHAQAPRPAAERGERKEAVGVDAPGAPARLPGVAFSFVDLAYTNSKWGFIDRTGKIVVPARYSRVDGFSDGLAAVKVGGTYAAGGKWGYIDRTGREVVAPRYDWARPFREGLAGVQMGDKWGFIDTDGKLVIAPRFESVERFSEGLAAVKENGLWGFIGPDGSYHVRPRYGWAVGFSEGLAAVRDPAPAGAKGGDRAPWRYIDRTGRTVIDLGPEFDAAGSFREERAGVTRGGLWGVIDRTGRVVVEPRYSAFEGFEDGRARVSVRRSVKVGGFVRTAGTKSGVIAADGTELGPLVPDYDNGVEIDPATGALSAVELDDRLDSARVTVIDFARLRPQGGLYRVSAPKQVGRMTVHTVGFVDRAGKVVIPPTLEKVGEFAEGLAPFAIGLDWKAVADAEKAAP